MYHFIKNPKMVMPQKNVQAYRKVDRCFKKKYPQKNAHAECIVKLTGVLNKNATKECSC